MKINYSCFQYSSVKANLESAECFKLGLPTKVTQKSGLTARSVLGFIYAHLILRIEKYYKNCLFRVN